MPFSYLKAALGTVDYSKRRLVAHRKAQLTEFLGSNQRPSFPKTTAPRVSIVILAYNHAYHTLQCLLSVLPMVEEQMEVIVFDNGSSDETALMLKRFDNLVVHTVRDNLGFVGGMNAASKHARAKFIAMLNNDARLMTGSLHKALDTFEATPSCGYMGFRIAHANGGLQEAGCLIFQNGTTSCYLRYEKEDDPRALFMRDVDFCSGVFFILEREVFHRLGGFDDYYAPAYYEETDLCMRLRREGLRCIYYPNLLVEHFEFGSGATSRSARAMIKRNLGKFLDRWSSTLMSQGFAQKYQVAGNERAALRLQPKPRRLLVVDKADFDVSAIEEFRRQGGTLTIYLLNANASQVSETIKKLDMSAECTGGKSKRDLERFMQKRQGTFEEIIDFKR
ncbi:MAG: glycosyltransferase [Aestuariivirga sp.]